MESKDVARTPTNGARTGETPYLVWDLIQGILRMEWGREGDPTTGADARREGEDGVGSPPTPTPEGKGKKELNPLSDVFHLPPYVSTPEEEREENGWTVVPHDPHVDRGRVWSPTIRAWIGGDLDSGRAMYSRYADDDPTWNPTPPPRLVNAQDTRGTPQGASTTLSGVPSHVEEGDTDLHSDMPAMFEPHEEFGAEAFFDSEGLVTHREGDWTGSLYGRIMHVYVDPEGRIRHVYVEPDSGEDPIHPLVDPGGQSWEEIMEEEGRITEENEQPRWMPGCHKERTEKEDIGKEEEEDRDGEGTLSRQATPGRSHQGKKGRNQAQQNHTAHKASTNFLQEPRANQANETKEAP
jgi:hypothetical protein